MENSNKGCAGCLWCWDLHNTGKWTCYNIKSHNYHCECTERCSQFESQPPVAKIDRWYKEGQHGNPAYMG